MLSNVSGSKRPYFTMCIALATAFAQISVFYYKKYKIIPMRPSHIRPFKVMAMAFLRLANLPTKIHIFIYFSFFLQGV